MPAAAAFDPAELRLLAQMYQDELGCLSPPQRQQQQQLLQRCCNDQGSFSQGLPAPSMAGAPASSLVNFSPSLEWFQDGSGAAFMSCCSPKSSLLTPAPAPPSFFTNMASMADGEAYPPSCSPRCYNPDGLQAGAPASAIRALPSSVYGLTSPLPSGRSCSTDGSGDSGCGLPTRDKSCCSRKLGVGSPGFSLLLPCCGMSPNNNAIVEASAGLPEKRPGPSHSPSATSARRSSHARNREAGPEQQLFPAASLVLNSSGQLQLGPGNLHSRMAPAGSSACDLSSWDGPAFSSTCSLRAGGEGDFVLSGC